MSLSSVPRPVRTCVRIPSRDTELRLHGSLFVGARDSARLKGGARAGGATAVLHGDYFIRPPARMCRTSPVESARHPSPASILRGRALALRQRYLLHHGVFMFPPPLYALSFRDPRPRGRHTHYSYLNVKRVDPRLFAGISLV